MLNLGFCSTDFETPPSVGRSCRNSFSPFHSVDWLTYRMQPPISAAWTFVCCSVERWNVLCANCSTDNLEHPLPPPWVSREKKRTVARADQESWIMLLLAGQLISLTNCNVETQQRAANNATRQDFGCLGGGCHAMWHIRFLRWHDFVMQVRFEF